MNTFFRGIVKLGLKPEMSVDLADEIKVINSIKLQGAIMIWITGLISMIFLPKHIPFILGLITTHLVVATVVFLLNQAGQYKTAKWFFTLDPAILVLILTGYFGEGSNFQYIALISFVMFIFLFRGRSFQDRLMLWIYLLVSITGLLLIYMTDTALGNPSSAEVQAIRVVVYALSVGLSIMMGVVLSLNQRSRYTRTQESLKESQKDAIILQSISDHMEEAIFKSSMSFGFVFVNEAFARMFGYEGKDEITATHPVNLYQSKTDRDALLTKLLKGGKVNNTLLQYRKKDGTFFWGRLNCQRIKEYDENFLVGTIVDVTPQQEQTERLEQREKQLREAQKLAKLGNWRVGSDGSDFEWSPECARIHGFLPADVEKPFDQWIEGLEDLSLEEVSEGLNKSNQMNQDFEFGSWYTSPSGDQRYLNYIGRQMIDREKTIWYGTVQDNTTLRRQEEELIATREFYQNILDSIPVETVLLDENQRYYYISKNAIRDDELRKWLVGKKDLDYAAYRNLKEDFAKTREEKVQNAFNSGLTIRWEEKMRTKDGRDSYHLRNLVPIDLDFQGERKRFVIGYSFDINEIKTAQFRLESNNEELKKLNKELDRFVYSISHDLRAPIASVLGLNSLAEDTHNREELEDILGMQREALDRLDRYIRDVIDYARNKRLDVTPEPVNVHRLVSECLMDLEYMSNYDRIEYFTEINETCEVVTDKVRIKIIINNLLSNAIKYADPKKEKSFVSIRGELESGLLKMQIADNGIGIKDDYKPQIWDIFFRGNSDIPGSGLGLYILKESVKTVEGNVSFESEAGKGTTFELTIPGLEY